MLSNQNHSEDLWQGGPWEQPSRPVATPIRLPQPPRSRRGRPQLRVKRRFPWRRLLVGTAVVALLVTGAVKLLPRISIVTIPPVSPSFSLPAPTQSQPELAAPVIPRSPTGSGVTVTLLPPALPPGQEEPLTNTDIYEKNVPSIVSIYASGSTDSDSGSGTGIVLTQDGYILTNAHVVSGANLVEVALHNNQVLDAKLVGFHATEDLAVLKVDAQNLTPAQFGSSDALRCGDPVVAIGDSLGYRSTITEGIVSALDREIDVDGVTMALIQTSAAINFGNSGGALINQYGQVVGITTIKIVSNDGSAESLGFAIPSTRVKYVVDRLIAGEEVRQGSFGFTVGTFPVDGGGLEIYFVDSRSDCYAKGVRAGDILLRANGQKVTGTQDLVHLKLTKGAGDIIQLELSRGGQVYSVDVALMDTATLN